MMKKTIRDYIREKIDYMNECGAKDMEEFCGDTDIQEGIDAIVTFISGCFWYNSGNPHFCIGGMDIGSNINLDFMENDEIKKYMIEYIDERIQDWLACDDDEFEENNESVRDETNIQIMNKYAYWYGCKGVDEEFFEDLLEELFNRNRTVLK